MIELEDAKVIRIINAFCIEHIENIFIRKRDVLHICDKFRDAELYRNR